MSLKDNKGIMQCEKELEWFLGDNDIAKKDDFSQEDLKHIREKFPEDSYIIVQHETTDKWKEHFKKEGIDATITPPDMRLGRLNKHGQAKIWEAGLYVEPPRGSYSGVLIAVKPSELGISHESSFGGCHTPECALFWNKDAIINAKIPPERILGSLDWQPKPKEQWKDEVHYSWNYEWKFNANESALQNKEMKAIIKCIEFPPLNWCKCS